MTPDLPTNSSASDAQAPTNAAPQSGFCAQCGASNARTVAFCARCGAPLPWAVPQSPAPAATAPAATAPPPPPPVAPSGAVPPPLPPAAPSAPPPPLVSPVPTQSVAPQSAPPTAPTISPWLRQLGAWLFPPHLLTAYRGATPQQLLRLYGGRVLGLLLLLWLVKSFAYELCALLMVASAGCLIAALRDPQTFRGLFGTGTSKATAGWTFGLLTLLLAGVATQLDPDKDKPKGASSPASSAPVNVAADQRTTTQRPNAQPASRPVQAPGSPSHTGVAASQQKSKPASAPTSASTSAPVTSPSVISPPASPVADAPQVDILGTHDINATILRQEGGLIVINQDRYAYRQVSVILNSSGLWGGFFFEAPQLAPGAQVVIAYEQFVTKKEARRFVPSLYKIEGVTLRCKTDYGVGVGSWTLNN